MNFFKHCSASWLSWHSAWQGASLASFRLSRATEFVALPASPFKIQYSHCPLCAVFCRFCCCCCRWAFKLFPLLLGVILRVSNVCHFSFLLFGVEAQKCILLHVFLWQNTGNIHCIQLVLCWQHLCLRELNIYMYVCVCSFVSWLSGRLVVFRLCSFGVYVYKGAWVCERCSDALLMQCSCWLKKQRKNNKDAANDG